MRVECVLRIVGRGVCVCVWEGNYILTSQRARRMGRPHAPLARACEGSLLPPPPFPRTGRPVAGEHTSPWPAPDPGPGYLARININPCACEVMSTLCPGMNTKDKPTAKAEARKEYRSQEGIVAWWEKDGAWHIALPCPDPDPETGLKTGGYKWTEANSPAVRLPLM